MSDRVFFDSTVLVYSVSERDWRMEVAGRLLVEGGVLGVQTLNEFASVAKRKLGFSWTEIVDSLGAIRRLCGPPRPLTAAIHEHGLRLASRYKYQIYDALIIAAALEAGCDVLYSEDMQHGQRIESLTIRNPFKPA